MYRCISRASSLIGFGGQRSLRSYSLIDGGRIIQAVREYREQERRDKADVANIQAAKRRARSDLRKKK
ncbi:MAG: hypothetical protein RL240_2976 [Planctomycetota bacterium]